MKALKEIILNYCDIITEGYKFETAEQAYDAIQSKKLGVKINPNFLVNNDDLKEFKARILRTRLSAFYTNAKSLGINDPTYGVQFLISHTSNIDQLSSAISNDAIFTYLQNYKKPWVKQLSKYNDFINKPYNRDTWHDFEKEIQENLDKHGKANKGSGIQDDVKILYPKDSEGWELKMPLSFAGSKAAAFYGKEGEEQKPTHWCTRADIRYYNHYTKNNKFPLYIFRNYKTGKSYQMAISYDEYNQVNIDFLDQNDNNGDEITNGDLSKIPDKLLSLIKFKNGKTLKNYKNEKTIDPNEGKKGFTTNFNTIKNNKIIEIPQTTINKLKNASEIFKAIKVFGPIMKGIDKNASEKLNSPEGTRKLKLYAETGRKIEYNARMKIGVRRYFFKKIPDLYVQIENNNIFYVSRSEKLLKQIEQITNNNSESYFFDDCRDYLEQVALLDSHLRIVDDDKKLKNKMEIKSHKETEKINSIRLKISDLIENQNKKYFPDGKIKVGKIASNWSLQNFADHIAYIDSFDVTINGKEKSVYLKKNSNGKYDEIINNSEINAKLQNIYNAVNRLARQLFSSKIAQARERRDFKNNGIYEQVQEEINNKFNY